MQSTQTEVKFLRAEVRALRERVAQLETELVESDQADDREFQALWPYRWIVGGIDKTCQCFHSFQLRTHRKEPQREPLRPKRRDQPVECGNRGFGAL